MILREYAALQSARIYPDKALLDCRGWGNKESGYVLERHVSMYAEERNTCASARHDGSLEPLERP